MKFSDKAYANKMALLTYTILNAILLLAYALEGIKGSRTLGYLLVFGAMCVIPVALDFIVYSRNKESRAICFITGTGYGILYLFAVFTTNSITTFTYAFPMFVVVTLFSDILYCCIFCSCAVVINIAYVIYHAAAVGYAAEEIPDVEIRVLCTLITGVYVLITTIAIRKINNEKVKQIREQGEKTDAMMQSILETSDSMITGVEKTTDKMTLLGESVAKIRESMGEVSTGSTETADSIQEQMQQTEQIQMHIVQVKETVRSIEDNMMDTGGKVKTGSEQMEELARQVDKSMEANNLVLRQMKELTEYTKQMNTIIETISNIADTTEMLSLNASIEAARAGESGRGFAVVAGEISTLANQTMTATVSITELINHINEELEEVAEAVDVVAKSNQANADSTMVVRENFTGIAKGAESVEGQTRELLEIVGSLEEANASIVERIQAISAITEEVSAHASETYESCEANGRVVEEVNAIVQDLNQNAEKLKKM